MSKTEKKRLRAEKYESKKMRKISLPDTSSGVANDRVPINLPNTALETHSLQHETVKSEELIGQVTALSMSNTTAKPHDKHQHTATTEALYLYLDKWDLSLPVRLLVISYSMLSASR